MKTQAHGHEAENCDQYSLIVRCTSKIVSRPQAKKLRDRDIVA